ncbi:hypothetical protein BDF22DRAFT_689428 [Syncephalis plumigaleata]|nr:hypothetical protein BDF22DRAFT_689428 [Syncephalis plumigaleata]
MKRHTDSGTLTDAKKVRFGNADTPNDDDHDEFDHESQLEERKTRRGAVRVEGYDNPSSDSEDGGQASEDDELTRRDIEEETPADQEPPAANDDDVDMFADEPVNTNNSRTTNNKQKKGKSTKNGILGDDDDDNEDGQDYTSYDYYDPSAGEYKIEAFNLRAELEEGKFDESGTYIQNAQDPQRFHDSWLEGVSEEDINKAHEAHRRREQELRQRLAQEERKIDDVAGATRAAQLDLLDYLQEDETVNAALKRLGGGIKRKKYGNSRKYKQQQSAMTEESNEMDAVNATNIEQRHSIELLTGLCDRLMSLGHLDVYDWTADHIRRDLEKQGVVMPEPATTATATTATSMGQMAESEFMVTGTTDDSKDDQRQWEFKWTADATDIHGPHSTAEIRAWTSYGYFNPDVLIRQLGEAEFSPIAELNIN